jgi:hypothetical protein
MNSDELLSPAESELQQSAFNRLIGYSAAIREFQQTHQPAAESPFAQGSRANGGIWWRETADLALAASFDHLEAFGTLLRGPIPRQAGYSVLRGSAEAAAIAWWVFDPDVSEAERIQRGFEERLHGMHSQRGLVEKNKEQLATQQAELVAEAARFGLVEVADTRSKGLTHLGQPRLGIQDLLVRVLPEKPPETSLTNGEILWRILSAYSHSESWTNMVGLKEAEDDTRPRKLTVNLPVLLRLCTLTVTAYDRAFSRRMQLAGHSTWEEQRGSLPRF